MNYSDATYVANDPRPHKNVVDLASDGYNQLHNYIKNKFDRYIIDPSTVDKLATYFNDMQATSPSPISAIGSTLTEDVYPIAKDIVTDPLTLVTLGASQLAPTAKAIAGWKSTPEGWELATKVDDVLNGRFKTVITPNYSRRGSSTDVLYRTGEDGNRYSIGGRDFAMEPASYSNSELAKSITGNPSIGNGNHRLMDDRMIGSKTLAQDNDYFATRLKDKKLMLSNKKYNPTGDANTKYWLNTDAMKQDAWNTNSGMRPVKVKGIKETDYMTDAQINKLAKDRAAKALRYNIDHPSLEQQLFKMSDNYSYNVPSGDYPREQFFGHFLPESDDAYNGIYPFRDMETYQIAGVKSTNPVHIWLQKKIDDGTVLSILEANGGSAKDIPYLSANPVLGQFVLRKLEPHLQSDYLAYLAKNKIPVRPSSSW